MSETLQEQSKTKGNIFQAIWGLKDILQQKPFMTFLFAMSGPMIIYMAFLAISSYIYIEWFDLSETEYSMFFAINSLILIVGPRIYLVLRNRISTKQTIGIGLATIALSAILILLFGKQSPYLFLITFFPITFASGFLRSFATNILLAQDNMNAGAAASVINFSNTAMGALGMLLGALAWSNYVEAISFIAFIGVGFSLIIWAMYLLKKYSLKGL